MSLITILIATTLTIVDGSKHTQTIVHRDSNVTIISTFMCNTPKSIRHMEELQLLIESTKASKVKQIECTNQ